MADDETTEAKPVTDQERLEAAADWEAYRVQFGANGAPAVLRAERRAFMGGWLARRHREGQAGS